MYRLVPGFRTSTKAFLTNGNAPTARKPRPTPCPSARAKSPCITKPAMGRTKDVFRLHFGGIHRVRIFSLKVATIDALLYSFFLSGFFSLAFRFLARAFKSVACWARRVLRSLAAGSKWTGSTITDNTLSSAKGKQIIEKSWGQPCRTRTVTGTKKGSARIELASCWSSSSISAKSAKVKLEERSEPSKS